MAGKRKVSNLLGLAVLSYLSERPMHPYALARALREHGDDRSIKFSHGSLYMVVGQLVRAGFVAGQETGRAGQRPEHTVYALTAAGREELRDWLRNLVEQPQHEYPAFVSALSLITALPPAEAVGLLRRRLAMLAAHRAQVNGIISESLGRQVPGIFLIEEEYRLDLLDTEIAFTERLITKMTNPEPEWTGGWAEYHESRQN